MDIDKKIVNKLWWICYRKFDTLGTKGCKRERTKVWLHYLETHGIQVRNSRENFFAWEDLVLFTGFPPRKSYKIGITREMAEKILVLGMP